MPARSNFSYTQLCIGDCGHVCDAWPVISGLGGTNPRVACRDCTAAEYGLDNAEVTGLYVWVRVKEKVEEHTGKPKKKTPPKKRTPKPNIWDQFLPGPK